MKVHFLSFLTCLAVLASCDSTEGIPGVYCNSDKDCAASGKRCYVQYHACVDADLGIPDMSMMCQSDCDGGTDMSTCGASCADAGGDGDMAYVDLKPM